MGPLLGCLAVREERDILTLYPSIRLTPAPVPQALVTARLRGPSPGSYRLWGAPSRLSRSAPLQPITPDSAPRRCVAAAAMVLVPGSCGS